MSANFDERDEILTLTFQLNDIERQMLVLLFDEHVDYQMREFEARKAEIKLLKRICLVKTLLFPLELPVTYFLLGKEASRERMESQSCYWRFVRNKISLEAFKNDLNSLIKNSNLGK